MSVAFSRIPLIGYLDHQTRSRRMIGGGEGFGGGGVVWSLVLEGRR